MRFRSELDGSVWDLITTDTFPTAGGWHHLLVSVDAANSITQIYIDDAIPALDFDIFVDRIIQWNTVQEFRVGADLTTSFANVDLAEFYVTNEHLDLSVESNRRKFISAGGKPVELGTDASDPTGTAPLIYFQGPTVSWHTNKGSGGGFTEIGAITDAATSPSD